MIAGASIIGCTVAYITEKYTNAKYIKWEGDEVLVNSMNFDIDLFWTPTLLLSSTFVSHFGAKHFLKANLLYYSFLHILI